MLLTVILKTMEQQEFDEFFRLLNEIQSNSSSINGAIIAVAINFVLLLILYWRYRISNNKTKKDIENFKLQKAEESYADEIKNRTTMANMMQEMLLRDSQEYRSSIKNELEETKREFAENENQRRELQAKVESLIEDLRLANQRLETATKNTFVVMGLKQQVNEMTIEVEGLRKEVKRLTDLNIQLTETIRLLELHIQEKDKTIKRLEEDLKGLQNGN